ncbi:MAG: hypothetical protein KDD41_04780 [Flavobacteriales bacterium]|nr:hypothetical protein [Flavobacteriales bacterium]
MFAIFGKKKIKEDVLANIFVNSVLDTIDQGFPEVVGIINDSPEFITSPNISAENNDGFTFIVIAANMTLVAKHLDHSVSDHMTSILLSKFSEAFDVEEDKFAQAVRKYQDYLCKVNHPSKNTLYAMSKAIFGKYGLNQYQDEYFKNMKSPNPMFLKRMDEAMENFVWNWEAFNQKHQIV